MTKTNWTLVAVAALGLAALDASAQASDKRITANIPFAFTVNGRSVLPAGNYTITRVSDRWAFQNKDAKKSALVGGGSVTAGDLYSEPKLKFWCASEVCALSDIEVGGGSVGYHMQVPKNAPENLVAKAVPLHR